MSKEASRALREFGIDIVGEIPWGTHLCQLYHTKQDLIDILGLTSQRDYEVTSTAVGSLLRLLK